VWPLGHGEWVGAAAQSVNEKIYFTEDSLLAIVLAFSAKANTGVCRIFATKIEMQTGMRSL